MCMATGETGVSGQPMGGGWRRLAFHLLLPWPSGLLLLQLADTAGWRDRRRRKRQAGYGRRRCWSLAPAGSAALPNTTNNRAGEHDLRAATVAEHDSAPSPTAALNQPDAPRPCPSPPPESSRLRPPRPRSRLVGEGRPLPPELSAHDGLTSCYLLLLCPKTVVEWRRAELASRRKDAGAGLK